MIINTVTDLKREYNQSSSGHWFDKDTIKFFKSRFGDKIYKGKYFISSEQREYDTPRLYTIREFFTVPIENCRYKIDIKTLGEFQGFTSNSQAKKYIENNL